MSSPSPGEPSVPNAPPAVPIDFLNFSVTMVEAFASGSGSPRSRLSTATGFFFEHSSKKYLVTNYHVVSDDKNQLYPDTLVFKIHTSPSDPRQTRDVTVPLYANGAKTWLEHQSGKEVDVVMIDVSRFVQSGDILSLINQGMYPPGNLILESSVNVLVIGYPLGFFDKMHNLPITRSAHLATPYGVPFEGKQFFLIDANLHPGSSGSPVFLPPATFRRDLSLQLVIGLTPSFLGIHSGSYRELGLNTVWYPQILLDILNPAPATPPSAPTTPPAP